jgi:flavin-binding protein dodecin
VKWLRRLIANVGRSPAESDAHIAETIERADVVLRNVDSVQFTVVPKNARALAELRRLNVRR